MKKIGMIIMIACLMLAFVGCNGSGSMQSIHNPQENAECTVQENGWELEASLDDAEGNQRQGAQKQRTLGMEIVFDGAEAIKAYQAVPENKESSGENKEAEAQEGAEEPEEEERELTEQEVKKLQWSLRSADNGFFACLYYRPEEVDWQTVFYMGAGLNVTLNEGQLDIIRENLREQIRQERQQEKEFWEIYLMSNDMYLEEEEDADEEEEEIEVNLTAGNVTTLTLRGIQNYVRNKTGTEYSEARHPLDWPQLTRNVFYFVHEDSNKVQVKLIRGTVKGNLYHLYYRLGNKRGATDPDYVMTVEIDGYQWKYISNLSLHQEEPITLLDIDYCSSGEQVRLLGAKEMIYTVEEEDGQAREDAFEAQQDAKGKTKAVTAPKNYWAVITAREDNTRIVVEKAYLEDEISSGLAAEGFFIPGERYAEVFLQKGEKIGIRVSLEDVPKARLFATSGNYYGEYAFGSENPLKRVESDGMPKSTYVVGHDIESEDRGTGYQYKDELLSFLKGTWVFYDGMQGDYTAQLVFDENDMVHLSVEGLTYELQIAKWNRVYADEGLAPDVVTFQAADEKTQEMINQWYPSIRKKMGDYRIRAVQKDGMQMLFLTPENSGAGCLNYLIPGAKEDSDEFVFYRFLGSTQEDGDDKKG